MLRLAAFLAALALLGAPARAAETAPHVTPRTAATLITDTDAVQPGAPLRLALRLRMQPGWHTYYQNPGDAGFPPELALTLPAGAAATSVEWPLPRRQPEGPLLTYGYTGDLVLPLSITPGAGPFALHAAAHWLVCAKVCIPEDAEFDLALPQGASTASPQAPLIAAALARLPQPGPAHATISPAGTLTVTAPGLSPATVRDAWFLPATPDQVDQGPPAEIEPGIVRITLHPKTLAYPLQGTVILTAPDGSERGLPVAATAAPELARPAPIWQALGLALLGGLLLNLMPCVFPVLAMKAVGLARLSGQGRRVVRTQALAYTVGVLLAFGALGLALLGLREAGAAAGWGFQFQSPAFVTGACWLLFAVGLNLSGVYTLGGRLAGAGQGLAAKPGLSGSFFTGLLAVLVASPCTAPFMAAALAAAAAAPPATAAAIFLALGLGLAAPTTLLAIAPALTRLLPRPGPWMDVLKGLLAFPMYAAAAWMAWVLSLQAGPEGVLLAAAGLVLLGLAGWSLGLAQASSRRWPRVLPALAVAAALALLPAVRPTPAPSQAEAGAEPYSPARLASLRGEGRPVFVNMTAAWCVSCLVNERLALSADPVRRAFAAHHVAYLKGDWTSPDPAITAFLREHGRDGVPLYVLYPPAGAPDILPQLLTQADLLARLDALGG